MITINLFWNFLLESVLLETFQRPTNKTPHYMWVNNRYFYCLSKIIVVRIFFYYFLFPPVLCFHKTIDLLCVIVFWPLCIWAILVIYFHLNFNDFVCYYILTTMLLYFANKFQFCPCPLISCVFLFFSLTHLKNKVHLLKNPKTNV